mgnify:CR=1 FL=1
MDWRCGENARRNFFLWCRQLFRTTANAPRPSCITAPLRDTLWFASDNWQPAWDMYLVARLG